MTPGAHDAGPAAPPRVAPHGAWRSPLTPRRAAAGATRFGGLDVSVGRDGRPVVWWTETLPDQEGRTALMACHGDGPPVEVGTPAVHPRSRVNEYGGGAMWVGRGRLFVVDERTQQVLDVAVGEGDPSTAPWRPRARTPRPPIPGGWRHAAGVVGGDDGAGGPQYCICERELHVDDAGRSLPQVVNELAVMGLAGTRAAELVVRTLVGPDDVGGGDFAVAPALSPDDGTLAWLRWDQPDMPWDAAELWVGALEVVDGLPRVRDARRIAGGRDGAPGAARPVSVCLPVWAPDGRLWWVDDADGWWHLRALDADALLPGAGDHAATVLGDVGEEFGEPRWVSGGRRYGITSDGSVVAASMSEGRDRLDLFDVATGERTAVPGPELTHVELVAVLGTTVAVVGGASDLPTTVWRIDLTSGRATDLRSAEPPLADGWISRPEHITFPTGSADPPDPPGVDRPAGGTSPVAHALFYPPANPDHVGPPGELPPLVVRIHGGPTAAARAELSASVQFWTTRGFAVVDVNYRGSVGYGRDYRDALAGRWGVADVEDCLAAARHLADSGRVHAERCVIRGSSAGGFTALAAVCFQSDMGFPAAFAAACSLYGVTDLATLAADTHKFEARYLDGLVAPLPEGAEVYRARSPLYHSDRLDRPVLLLQGTEDRVVPPSQAQVLVDALRANGVPHAVVMFEGEGHGFRSPGTVVAALEAELGFYGRVLGVDPADLGEPFELDEP